MSALTNASELNSFKANERQQMKSSLDREYQLLTANQSVFSMSKNLERGTYDGSKDQFWKEASIRSERRTSNNPDAPAENLPANNKYYKHEIQNLRSSLNEMRDKAQRTKLMTSELRTTNTKHLEQISEEDKDRVKQLQAEREEEMAVNLSHREGVRSPLERNPIDSAGKKKVRLAYQEKEKEVYNRVIGNSTGKEKDNYVSSNYNSRTFNQSIENKREEELQEKDESPNNDENEEEGNLSNNKSGYFTNKELVRAKYEQYEKDLLKKKDKSHQKKLLEERSQNKDVSSPDVEEKKIEARRQSGHYPVEEIMIRDERNYESYRRSHNNNDDCGRALEKKERKLQEEYENLEREKSWRNRGLVYRETWNQQDLEDEPKIENKVQYVPKTVPNSEFLVLELEKLKDENQRIKQEIKDIQNRNNIQKRHYSAKLTHEDFQMSSKDSFYGSRKLSKVKNERQIEDTGAYSVVRKGDDIRKTIQRARKSVHKKMETSRQERSWKEARQRSTASVEDVFIGYKTGSRSAKFHAGVPTNHLRESAFLLARGIPTTYTSNRNINELTKSLRSSTSRSFRK